VFAASKPDLLPLLNVNNGADRGVFGSRTGTLLMANRIKVCLHNVGAGRAAFGNAFEVTPLVSYQCCGRVARLDGRSVRLVLNSLGIYPFRAGDRPV
jgi:hypothetical protein